MRVFLGMMFGAILTVVGAYSYDVVTGKAVNSTDAPSSVAVDGRPMVIDGRPMVNWDVVGRHWQSLETNLREMTTRVHEQWTKRSG